MELPENYLTPVIGKTTERRVVLCDYCKGTAEVPVYNFNPAYEGPYTQQCPVCKGAGRRWMITTIDYDIFTQ